MSDTNVQVNRNVSIVWVILGLALFNFKATGTIATELQMQLGNPSSATADTNNHDHYLIQRTVEAIDYSDNLGEPVWASWDLTTGDVGSAPRSTTYYTDTNLPPNFYRVTTTDYNGVGNIDFNRGHLCPSEDRTDTTNDNKLVFFMSNIMPQSGPNNQGVWANLESDWVSTCQTINDFIVIAPRRAPCQRLEAVFFRGFLSLVIRFFDANRFDFAFIVGSHQEHD